MELVRQDKVRETRVAKEEDEGSDSERDLDSGAPADASALCATRSEGKGEGEGESEGVGGTEHDRGLAECTAAIEEKEALLNQLLVSAAQFTGMKAELERLSVVSETLEHERQDLEKQLAVLALQPAHQMQQTQPTQQTERLRALLAKKVAQLDAAHREQQRGKDAFRRVQRDAGRCEDMRREIDKLRETRTLLTQSRRQNRRLVQVWVGPFVLVFSLGLPASHLHPTCLSEFLATCASAAEG
jgi:hypothetical protein